MKLNCVVVSLVSKIINSLRFFNFVSRYRHRNIVALLAYCMDGPSPCLLYEFMENGSLEDNLLCKVSNFHKVRFKQLAQSQV